MRSPSYEPNVLFVNDFVYHSVELVVSCCSDSTLFQHSFLLFILTLLWRINDAFTSVYADRPPTCFRRCIRGCDVAHTKLIKRNPSLSSPQTHAKNLNYYQFQMETSDTDKSAVSIPSLLLLFCVCVLFLCLHDSLVCLYPIFFSLLNVLESVSLCQCGWPFSWYLHPYD